MKTIAFDVDGVVADILTEWLDRYNKEWNDVLTPNNITEWGIDKFVKPGCGKHIFKYLDDPSLYDNVFPYLGALECVNKLKEQGYRIVWATSSPALSYGRKFFWLKEHGFISDQKDYFETQDKSLIRADVLVDDYQNNLSDFIGRRILLSRPWNTNSLTNLLSTFRADDYTHIVIIMDYFRMFNMFGEDNER
jgi:5'-nucleotidase